MAGTAAAESAVNWARDPFGSIATVVFGAIGVRNWCDLLTVLFKVNKALQDIRHMDQHEEDEDCHVLARREVRIDPALA